MYGPKSCKGSKYRSLIWALRPFNLGVLAAVKVTCRVYSRYIRIPGLRVHTRAHGFHFRTQIMASHPQPWKKSMDNDMETGFL